MAWAKLDDQFFVNRKARAAGLEGRSLFLASVCYCAMQQNDGVFPVGDLEVVAAMAGVPQTVGERLVNIGLWHATDGGYEVHEYLQYNPSREQIVARKERAEKAANARHHATSNASGSPPGNAPALPLPSPSPASRSSSSSVTSTVPDDVWKTLAKKKLASTTGVKNVPSWLRKVIENDRAELGEEAQRLWDTYEISPSHLADVLANGGSSPSLNHLRRREAS